MAAVFILLVQHERSREMNLTVGHSPLEFQECTRLVDCDRHSKHVERQTELVVIP